MQSTDDLVKDLAALPRRKYVEVLKKVNEQRRLASERSEPWPGMGRDDFARWIGQEHYSLDPGVSRVYYLPGNSPEDQVRLVEINELARIPDGAPIVAVDFMPDLEHVDYSLYVADVSPSQWVGVGRHEVDLPDGWTLDGMVQVAPVDA